MIFVVQIVCCAPISFELDFCPFVSHLHSQMLLATFFYIFHLDIKKSPRTAAPPPSRRMISDRRMTPDPLDGLKRKKVKVLLRKMIPAPLLSHISSDEDIEERFSTTPMTVKKEHNNIQVNI